MKFENRYCTYKELAQAIGCSYNYVVQVHAKRIIEAFNIDKKRLPRAGVLPVDLVEKYFDLSFDIETKEKTN